MASVSGQSSFDPDDVLTDDEVYSTPNPVAEMTPVQRDCAARILIATRLLLNSPPEAPKNWAEIVPNLNDYHSDPMDISGTFWITDIIDWWRQQEEMKSKYTDLSNVEQDIFSIIPHGVGVETSISLPPDVISWTQWKTTGKTLHRDVVLSQLPWANNSILSGDNPAVDRTNTENDSEMINDEEATSLHRMAKVQDLLEMLQGIPNLRATQKKCRGLHQHMTAIW